MERYVGRTREGEPPQQAAQAAQAAAQPPKAQQSHSMVFMLKDILLLSAANWKWYLLSVIIALCIGVWYLKTTAPIYQRSISILIKPKENVSNDLLKELGFDYSSSNLMNEMELLRTSNIGMEIATRLNLNVEYYKKGPFHDVLLYGQESPVNISFLTLPETEGLTLSMTVNNDSTVTFRPISGGNAVRVPVDKKVNSPWGELIVKATPSFGEYAGQTLRVRHRDMKVVGRAVKNHIKPSLRNKSATIIDIRYNDISKARAEDILTTLVGVYNENWIKDRNLKTLNTDKFIKERLAFIEDELGDVEQHISTWKSQNLMLDVGAAGNFAQTQVNEAERDLQDLSNQIYMSRYIRDYLTDGKHADQLLPANSGITNSSIEQLISEYNTTLLNRNNHLVASSSQNPLVRDLEENLATLKGSILQSLDYELTMLQSKANNIKGRQGLAISRVASNPAKAQQLLSVERQQKVKEELYLYLLEKREENELSQAFDAYNNQFIEAPHGPNRPIEPKTSSVLLVAFAIGLFVPCSVITVREMLNTKVRGKKDLKILSVPYVGDIPTHIEPKRRRKMLKGKKDQDVKPKVLVVDKDRDLVNEAFRVVRTNLEFMLGYEACHKCIMITSMTPGSGKTFITANLSAALALRHRKVLIIDLDLRKGSLSRYLDNSDMGLSNYLSGQVADYSEVVQRLGNVDIIPSGDLPPNPAELLLTERFSKLVEEVKEEYDFVFLDCPPVEVVADASIVSKYADLTLFVVRVGNLERDQLPEIEEWYYNTKYGNLAVILNGVESSGSRYGYHRFGYHRYGYHRYGYQYGSNGKEKK